MRKKLITAVLLSLILVLMLGVTAFAGDDTEAPNEVEEITEPVDKAPEEFVEEENGDSDIKEIVDSDAEEVEVTIELEAEEEPTEPAAEERIAEEPVSEETIKEAVPLADETVGNITEISEPETKADDKTSTSGGAFVIKFIRTTDEGEITCQFNGGSEEGISVKDILTEFGYEIESDTQIDVVEESVDTEVIGIRRTDAGLFITDNGMFTKASKDLVIIVNGEQVSLSVADDLTYWYPEYNTTDDPKSGIKKWKSGTLAEGDYKYVTTDTDELTTGWWVVSGEVSKRLTISGSVNLLLLNGAKLTATGPKATDKSKSIPGILVTGDNSLTIYAQSENGTTGETTGQLIAKGIIYSAGIGGGGASTNKNSGNIIINGGIITSTVTGDNAEAAGFGGGSGGNGSNITINGGNVIATGNGSGSAIGGGSGGNGSNITINGGSVEANAHYGAGIGGGTGGSGSNITINGGKVEATSSNGKWGIGDGNNGSGSDNIKVKAMLEVYVTDTREGQLVQIEHDDNTDLADNPYPLKKYVVIEPISHSWSYSIIKTATENDTIQATCSDTPCPIQTTKLILSADSPSATYDTSGHGASAVEQNNKSTTTDAFTGWTITYLNESGSSIGSNAPVAAGTYKAKLSLKVGSKTYEIFTAPFTITPKIITVTGTVINASREYDGTKVISVTNIGTLSGVCQGDVNNVELSSAVATVDSADVGQDKAVTIKYTITGTSAGNYSVSDSTDKKASIVKAKVTAPTAETNLIYTGSEQTGVELPSDAKYTLSGNKGINVGSYTATAVLSDKTNYEWNLTTATSDDQVVPWSITRADPTAADFTVTKPENLVYNGNNKTVSETTTKTGMGSVTIKYFKDSAEVTATKDAGTYSFALIVAEGDNYNSKTITDDKWTFTVEKAQISVSGTSANGKTYDGTAAATALIGTPSGIISGEDVQVSVDSATFDNKTVGTAKTVTVVYSITGNDADNYKTPENGTCYADITAKQLTVSGTEVSDKEYDGTENIPVIKEGTLSGCVEGDLVEWDTISAKCSDKNAGAGKNVTITYSIKGDDSGNYLAPIADSSNKVTITVRQLIVSRTTIEDSRIYDGTVVSKITEVGTLDNKVEGDIITLSATAVYADMNVGSGKNVTVTYAITGSDAGNYAAPENLSTGASITAKEVTLKWTAPSNLVYDKTAKDALAKAGDLVGDDTCTVSVELTSGKDNVNVGKFTFTAKSLSNSNYKLPSNVTSEEYQINPKEVTLTWTAPSTLVYDKTAKDPTARAGNLVQGDSCTVSVELTSGKNNVNVGKFTYTAKSLSNSNYKLPTTAVSEEYEITAKEVTVSGTTVANKVYDGTTAITVSQNGTLEGIVGGDVVTISKATAIANNANVGTAVPVIVRFEISGADATNYSVENVSTLTVSITKATPDATDFTVTLPENLVYDGTEKTVEVTPKHEGMGSITVKYYQDGKEVTSAKDVGTYVYKLVVNVGANYHAGTVSDDTWTFNITEAPPAPYSGNNDDGQIVIEVGINTLTEAQVKAVEKALEGNGFTLVNVLNISKKNADKEHYIATITIEPKYFEGYNPSTLKVWKVNDDNTLTNVTFTVVNGKIIINSGKLGIYIITVD